MSQAVAVDEVDDLVACWCCGDEYPAAAVIHLGSHPEVGVCLGCARYLHLQANARRDALHRSPAARVRDKLRAGRGLVIRRGWHRKPFIGAVVRWLGRHTP